MENRAVFDILWKVVQDKNWFWSNDYKIFNSVYVYGCCYEFYGLDNYLVEIWKICVLMVVRDIVIWKFLQGEFYDLKVVDVCILSLLFVEINFDLVDGLIFYWYGVEVEVILIIVFGY